MSFLEPAFAVRRLFIDIRHHAEHCVDDTVGQVHLEYNFSHCLCEIINLIVIMSDVVLKYINRTSYCL